MEVVVEDFGEFEAHAGSGGEFGSRRRLHLLDAPEVHLQLLSAFGADAGNVFEDRARRLLAPHLRL